MQRLRNGCILFKICMVFGNFTVYCFDRFCKISGLTINGFPVWTWVLKKVVSVFVCFVVVVSSAESMDAGKENERVGDEEKETGVSFLFDLMHAPCFRQSAMTGVGGGAVIGGLNFYRNSR